MDLKDQTPLKKWVINRLLLAIAGLLFFFGLVEMNLWESLHGTTYIATGCIFMAAFLVTFWSFWIKGKKKSRKKKK